mmetsp:Transcript_88708/g.246363  ORF Transcript_88708/g.246363 Transcript_88708/m.246363 type:complete len:227 (-) Transcript_88708:2-682(-)
MLTRASASTRQSSAIDASCCSSMSACACNRSCCRPSIASAVWRCCSCRWPCNLWSAIASRTLAQMSRTSLLSAAPRLASSSRSCWTSARRSSPSRLSWPAKACASAHRRAIWRANFCSSCCISVRSTLAISSFRGLRKSPSAHGTRGGLTPAPSPMDRALPGSPWARGASPAGPQPPSARAVGAMRGSPSESPRRSPSASAWTFASMAPRKGVGACGRKRDRSRQP